MSTEPNQVITAAEVRAVETERVSLLATFAHRYGLEANNMMRTLRATVLRPALNGAEPSNEQVAAFLIVAHHHRLNPFTREIHGFVDKRGGIVPIVGIDGWATKINEHPAFDGMDFSQTDEACTCTMYRKDRTHPVVVTEYLTECRQSSPAWTTHPKRMLRHRAMIQCARIAFALVGLYDPDEGEQVLAAQNDAIDVTPVKLAPRKISELADAMNAAVKAEDAVALKKIYGGLSSDEQLAIWPHLRSNERSAIKKLLAGAKGPADGQELGPWAVETIKASKGPEALQETWRLVQDAYQEADQEVPADVETVYIDRKAELGA
jgi:phage recombination protein Bet